MSNVIQVISAAGVVDTLTGNSGGAVGPTGANISIIGIDGITVTGYPLTSTLTIGGGGGGALTITGDSGGAVSPDASNWTFVGAGGLTIAGDDLTGTLTFTQSGGGGTITAVDSGDNITVNTVGTVATVNLNESILQPPTSADASEGVYALGSVSPAHDYFMHNYGTENTFLGYGSGNLTNTSDSIVAIGYAAAHDITSATNSVYIGHSAGTVVQDCINNTIIGDGSGTSMVTLCNNNTIVGGGSFAYATESSSNCGLGESVLLNLVSGNRSVCIGADSGAYLENASDNLLLGYQSGLAYLSNESSNVILASFGVVNDQNCIRIGTQGSASGQQNKAYIAGIYANTVDAGSQQLVIVDNVGKLGSTSDGGFASTFDADAGSAAPSSGIITMAGGSNFNTSASGDQVEFNLNNTVSISGSMTAGTGLIATTGGVTTTGTNTFNSLGAGVMQTSSAGVISSSNGTNGQVLIGGGAAPAWANITSTDGSVTITNGANTIDLSTEGSVIPGCRIWTGVASGGANAPIFYECTSSTLTSTAGTQVLTIGPAMPATYFLNCELTAAVMKMSTGAYVMRGVQASANSVFNGGSLLLASSWQSGVSTPSPTASISIGGSTTHLSVTFTGDGTPWLCNLTATFSITTF